MIIKNGRLIMSDRILENFNLRIENGIIKSIEKNCSEDDEVIDASEMYVCPGFIDIHTHGGGGGDFMDADNISFDSALDFHCKNGTTSLLATSVTAPVEDIVNMLKIVRTYKDIASPVCRILGAHIEGPYISLKNKGAQHESFLRIPARDQYDFIIENRDVIRTVTIAPELDGAEKMTKELTKAGIVVCGGHDYGEKELIMPVIAAGLTHCTHLWCAMSSVTTASILKGKRSVGLLEIGLSDDRLSVEIIADNFHITPDMMRLVYKCKGADNICVVSDSLRAAGMPEDGRLYYLGSKNDKTSQHFIVSDGVAKLPDKSRYAGSICPLSKMVKNLVDAGINIIDAVKTASLTPAKIIKQDHTIGSIATGKYADICIMNKNFEVMTTLVNGEVKYRCFN